MKKNKTAILFPKEIKPVKKGEKIPEVKLKDLNGNIFDLNDSVRKKHSIIIFYRGGWCPFCNMHFSALAKVEGELREMGFAITAISPDTPEELGKTMEKHGITYTLLSDSSMDAAKKFGIAFKLSGLTRNVYKVVGMDIERASGEKHHMLPVPAVFIVGKDEVVKYSYVNPNYMVRLDPGELMKQAEKLYKGSKEND